MPHNRGRRAGANPTPAQARAVTTQPRAVAAPVVSSQTNAGSDAQQRWDVFANAPANTTQATEATPLLTADQVAEVVPVVVAQAPPRRVLIDGDGDHVQCIDPAHRDLEAFQDWRADVSKRDAEFTALIHWAKFEMMTFSWSNPTHVQLLWARYSRLQKPLPVYEWPAGKKRMGWNHILMHAVPMDEAEVVMTRWLNSRAYGTFFRERELAYQGPGCWRRIAPWVGLAWTNSVYDWCCLGSRGVPGAEAGGSF